MRILALVSLLLFACDRAANGDASPFDRAALAADQGKFRDAAKLFAEAAKSDPDPERREKAEIRAANIGWRVFLEYDAARARLQNITSTPGRIELARIAEAKNDFATARVEAKRAIAAAVKPREHPRATIVLARAIVRDPKATAAELAETVASLRALIASEGPRHEAARLLAGAALRVGNGAAALEGIDGYYHVSAFNPPPNAIAPAHATLARMLPSWKGTPAERDALAQALGGIRFFDEAAFVAPSSDVAAYAASLRKLTAVTNEYYRQMANDDEDYDDLTDALKPFKRDQKQLAKRFGAHFITGETGGYKDLHYGHIVVDRTMNVEQYGQSATVRFVALDTMASNGYNEWRFDGTSGDGGWGTAEEIYQVRPRYADGPLGDWALATDAATRAEDDRLTALETARDREREKTNPIQSFPGLNRRLHRQYVDAVFAGPRARDAFLARVEQDDFTSSIVLHEGRHAIDARSGKNYKTWELEYRAKLSQIALAPAPRSALESMLSYEIGGASPHGKANDKVVRGLVAWMEANRAAIAGLDPSRPMLPQADRLTDEQIKAAVRSLDPMAK